MAGPVDLSACNAAVIVFAMDGCGACDQYIPRLLEQVEALRGHGYPFTVYSSGQPVAQGEIPVLLYDAASPDPDVQRLADRFAVEATPTTVVVARRGGSFKVEGSIADNQILWILNMANEENR